MRHFDHDLLSLIVFDSQFFSLFVPRQDLQLFDEIRWIGSGPPVAEPKCGFRGQKCISK